MTNINSTNGWRNAWGCDSSAMRQPPSCMGLHLIHPEIPKVFKRARFPLKAAIRDNVAADQRDKGESALVPAALITVARLTIPE